MPTYLYCLLLRETAADSVEAPATGIAGAPVRILPAGPIEAWVSGLDAGPPSPSVEAVREHDRVVSAALATGRTPLPARFGQVWPSDDACVTALTRRTGELEPLLRGVAGLVEMSVHTLLPGMPPAAQRPPADRSAPGTAYLHGLRARADRERHLRAALEALRKRVAQALGPLARDESAEIRGSDEALALSVSYLVDRGSEGRFREAVSEVERDSAARLVVAGPRAPYSFAPRAGAEPGHALEHPGPT
jgi:hypothetical protein